jgi:putative chitinase
MNFKVKYRTLLGAFFINTKKRYDHLMAQLEHESRLELKREGGYYRTIGQARDTFKTPFRGKSDAFVKSYLKDSVKMLNYVYANRMGNGDEASGDGYKYRAGGYIGITGKGNYLVMSKDTGIDFIGNPDLILEEANCLVSALWFWQKHKLNTFADEDDIDSISDIINIGSTTRKYGDSNGFKDRKELYDKYEAMD